MSTLEKETLKYSKKIELEEIAPGVRGRTLPVDEPDVTEDQVRRLAEGASSEAFADFIYRLYKVKRPQRNTEKSGTA